LKQTTNLVSLMTNYHRRHIHRWNKLQRLYSDILASYR
jgi:hypothetical protein